jgi:hypothetical protein
VRPFYTISLEIHNNPPGDGATLLGKSHISGPMTTPMSGSVYRMSSKVGRRRYAPVPAEASGSSGGPSRPKGLPRSTTLTGWHWVHLPEP